MTPSVFAQVAPAPLTDPGPDVQRLQEQRAEQAHEHANTHPDVFTPPASVQVILLSTLPKETSCSQINDITLEDNVSWWLPDLLKPVNNQCVGRRGLKVIELQVSDALIRRGYVTSRVLIPKQSLTGGALQPKVLAGHIGIIRNALDNSIDWARMVLLTDPGDLLNQRDLGQALESIRRLPSQLQTGSGIVPGERIGESDIMLKPGTDKR